MRSVESVTFLEDDDEITIEGVVHYSVDREYGADADGNRGCKRIEVTDVTDIQAFEIDGKQLEISKEKIEEYSELLTNKFLEG